MSTTAFRFIPIVMGMITTGTFLFFLSYELTGHPFPHQQRIIPSAVASSKLRTSPRKRDHSNVINVRKSPREDTLWPNILDISPAYLSKFSVVNPSIDAALNVTTYPQYISLLQVIESWNPDQPDTPSTFVETLQHFNYSDPYERKLAARYRDAEVPFKLYDIPEVDKTVKRWSEDYLKDVLRRSNSVVEVSHTNHFMFWKKKNMKKWYPTWEEPTTHIQMPYDEWLKIAEDADANKLTDKTPHYYFHVNAVAGDRKTFVAKDLPYFATDRNNFFITNVDANKGIQCRFGMRGIIAETHYDGGKNMVAMIKGQKRYILTPPDTCKYLGIITDKKHSSFRHSIIDWSNVEECKAANFDKAAAIDTIVREGEILYIPSYWFHYPVSLQYSIQCNSRSGSPPRGEGQREIESCTGVDMKDQLKKYNSRSGYKKEKENEKH